jgi:tripartite-type tricarboxylate transporter receptor subunit TctC
VVAPAAWATASLRPHIAFPIARIRALIGAEEAMPRRTLAPSALLALAACAVFCATPPAVAQDWPARPITIVVPYAAGGPNDTITRVLTARLTEILSAQIIIENVGGAGGMTGSYRVAKAAPDGYTVLLGGLAVLAQLPNLYKHPLYNPQTDFEPVALITDSARILIARKDFPADTLAQFIAYAKANQATLRYSSAGGGSGGHVCAILLDTLIGTHIAHVPYRGAGPAMQDMMAGRIDYSCEQISTAFPQIEAGAVKAIATLGPTRPSVLANLPTAAEQGLPGLDCNAWIALVFPKGTPQPIVRRLADATSEALDSPNLRERLDNLGVTAAAPERRTPAYLAAFIRAELDKWAAPIKASGVSID